MHKRNREPSELEKTYMVRHIWLSERQGMPERTLKKEREWLGQKFDCKLGRTSAITAHMRIRLQNIVPGQLTFKNAQFARRWVALAGSVPEREKLQAEVAEYLIVDKSVIEAITDGVREEVEELVNESTDDDVRVEDVEPAPKKEKPSDPLEANLPDYHVRFIEAYVRLAKSQNKPLAPVFAELAAHYKVRPAAIRALVEEPHAVSVGSPPASRPQTVPKDVPHFDRVRGLKSGEHVDYETKSKEAWRQKWKQFIEENTDPAQRPSMRVLCLPGKRMLEIPLYLELGFRIENIVAVEGGDRIAQADCELTAKRNAAKWGGMPDLRLMGLEEVLEQEKGSSRKSGEKGEKMVDRPFDVVSLDFFGQMCVTNLRIASKVPVSDRALFLITMWTRRWKKKDMQQWRQDAIDRVGVHEQERMKIEQEYRDRAGGGSVASPEGAPDDFPMATVNLGADREEHWLFRQRMRRMPILPEARSLQTTHQREREERNIGIALEPVVDKLLATLQEHGLLDVRDMEQVRSACNLGRLVSTTMFDKPVIDRLQRWSYRSTVSDSLHEFHTDMAVVARPGRRNTSWHPIVDFLSHAVEHLLELLHRGDAPEEVLARMHFELHRGRPAQAVQGKGMDTDMLVCLLDGRSIGHKSVNDVLAATADFTRFLQESPHADPSVFSRIPRREIHYK